MSTVSSFKPVLDQLAELADCDSQLVVSDPQFPVSALVKRLSLVPDRRKLRGLRHQLAVVLALTACATPVTTR